MKSSTRSKVSRTNIFALAVSVVLAEMAGAVGAIFTVPSIPVWYAALAKPFFTPPSWLFGPVWTTLFLMMGIAAFLVWRRGSLAGARGALALYGTQLVVNVAWSLLFFGLHSPAAAFVDILLLLVLIILTMVRFFKINTVAGRLFVPYFLWVSFAAVLNFSIWQLNP